MGAFPAKMSIVEKLFALTFAMIAVGVYGPNALRSLRFAGARVLVAISLGIIV